MAGEHRTVSTDMKLTIAKTAGFCFGVDRAVTMALDIAGGGTDVYTVGPLIHNARVVAALQEQGVYCADEPRQVPSGASVIIRSHGVGRNTYSQLEQRGLKIIDATCPFVTKIHEIVRKQEKLGHGIIIIGAPAHPEVVGIAGWCQDALIIDGPEQAQAWISKNSGVDDRQISVVCQTTYNRTLWLECLQILKKRYTKLKIFDTICSATDSRQKEAISLASSSDMMLVVGDGTSSNTGQLVAVCRLACDNVLRIEDASDIWPGHPSLENVGSIGIAAGGIGAGVGN